MIVDVHSQLGRHPLYPFEQDADDILRDMKRYGMDRAFLLPVPRMRFGEANDAVARTVKQHPDEFVGFLNVNPVDPAAVDEVDRAVGLGLKGLMIDPEFHYGMERPLAPGDRHLPPLLEKAVEHGLPVLVSIPNIRVGHSERNALNLRDGLDELLGRFPEVRLLVDLFWPGIVELARRHANLLVDTAGASAGRISDLTSQLGATRILFGSNSPRYHPGNHLQAIRWARISPKQKALILGENASRIFKELL